MRVLRCRMERRGRATPRLVGRPRRGQGSCRDPKHAARTACDRRGLRSRCRRRTQTGICLLGWVWKIQRLMIDETMTSVANRLSHSNISGLRIPMHIEHYSCYHSSRFWQSTWLTVAILYSSGSSRSTSCLDCGRAPSQMRFLNCF